MGNDPVMLITGTRKGIGRHLAEYYVAQGYRVVGCSRREADFSLEGYEHASLDVTDEAGACALFARIRKTHGRLDALINNAGIASMNRALLTPLSAARKMLDTNVAGAFLFCREAAKIMQKEGRGRIVNFSTVAIPLALEGESLYAASKAAVETMTRILGREFAPFGITCNAVAPGPIETDLIKAVPKAVIDALIQSLAIKRMGRLEDVTNIIDFFLRPQSDYITGQVLYMGGVGS